MRRCKNCAHKAIFWKYLSKNLSVFSRAQSASFSSPPRTPFMECWKSTAAAAHDLTLVEVDGKYQFVAAKINYLKTMNTQHPRPTGARGLIEWYCPVTLPPTNQRIINNLITFLVTARPATPNMAFRSAAAAKSLQSCLTLCDPRDGSPQAPASLGFFRPEHWSGLPFP